MWRYAGAHLYVIGGAFIKRSRLATNVPSSRRTVDVFVHDLNVLFLWSFGLFYSNVGCRAVDREDGKFQSYADPPKFFLCSMDGHGSV